MLEMNLEKTLRKTHLVCAVWPFTSKGLALQQGEHTAHAAAVPSNHARGASRVAPTHGDDEAAAPGYLAPRVPPRRGSGGHPSQALWHRSSQVLQWKCLSKIVSTNLFYTNIQYHNTLFLKPAALAPSNRPLPRHPSWAVPSGHPSSVTPRDRSLGMELKMDFLRQKTTALLIDFRCPNNFRVSGSAPVAA